MTSAIRSSSVAPFGVATVDSHPTDPVARSSPIRRPPAVPKNTPPRTIVAPALLRTVSGGFARWYTHTVEPSRVDSAYTRPSPENTTAVPSAALGDAMTSLPTLTDHSALPSSGENASTSPLSVPTITANVSAPTPAESVRPALTRHTWRPLAGSMRTIVPSADAA